MKYVKPLTEKEKIKIANILERTNAGTFDFIGMMIEMHTLGIKPTEHGSLYQFKFEHVQPQVKSALYDERFDGEKYPKFSKFLMDKINQFEDEVITPWFFEAYKVVSEEMDEMDVDWNDEYVQDFNEYIGCLTDHLINVLECKEIPTYMFGIDELEEEMEVENGK